MTNRLISLIECEARFSEEDMQEIKGFLSKLPDSHLKSLNHIERFRRLNSPNNVPARSNPNGCGEEIELSDIFYDLTPEQRAFVFLHEMGHNYFAFKDYWEGNIPKLKEGPCRKQDVSHLLKVRWMELGWELNQNFKLVRAMDPKNKANRDKYTYMVLYKNPNRHVGEWQCSPKSQIPKNSFKSAFRYGNLGYSPNEELADAYALFVLEREHFLKGTEQSETVKAKYDLIQEQFKEKDLGQIELMRATEHLPLPHSSSFLY